MILETDLKIIPYLDTPGSIAILDINNRVLIAGDSVQDGNIFMFKEHEYVPVC